MDINTLAITTIAVHLTIFFANLAMSLYRKNRSMVIYASYFVTTAIALLLTGQQSKLNPWLGVVAANVLFVLSYLQLFSGLRDYYHERKIWPSYFWVYLGIIILTYILLSIINFHFLIRTLIRYLLTLLILLQIHVYLRPHYMKMSLASRYTLQASIWINIASFLIQSVVLLTFGLDSNALSTQPRIYITMYISRIIFAIIWAYSIVLLDQGNLHQELESKNQQLADLVMIDPLTQLYNRNRYLQSSSDILKIAIRFARPISLILIDIDFFKRVNDSFGHAVGDQVLVQIARILKNGTRSTDQVIRWGGEEFVIMALGTDLVGAVHLAESLRMRIASESFEQVGQMTASFGVAELAEGEHEDALFKRADAALYQAKELGRNRVVADRKES